MKANRLRENRRPESTTGREVVQSKNRCLRCSIRVLSAIAADFSKPRFLGGQMRLNCGPKLLLAESLRYRISTLSLRGV